MQAASLTDGSCHWDQTQTTGYLKFQNLLELKERKCTRVRLRMEVHLQPFEIPKSAPTDLNAIFGERYRTRDTNSIAISYTSEISAEVSN